MATYEELFTLANGDPQGEALRNKVAVACMIAALAIAAEADTVPNHANRLIWAKSVLANPLAAGNQMYPAVLAANAGAPVATILNASDALIQTAVNDSVNLLAQGA